MRAILIIKSIINLLIGILVITLRESMLTYLSFVIAGALLIESVEDLIYCFIKKTYQKQKDALYTPLALLFVSIILIVENILTPTPESNIEFVCIIWGTVSIFSACRDLDGAVHHFQDKKKFLLHLAKGSIALIFAFLLMLNPLEHVIFHLVILGIEFIVEALELSLHWIRYRNPRELHLDAHTIEEIEKIHAFIEEHPSKEEEILNSIKHK